MTLTITDRAVARIVAMAAASVPGTTSLERGLDRLAGRTYPRYDVEVDEYSNSCSVEAFIAVTWPSPVTLVAEAVRTTITEWVQALTGLAVTRVNVVVGPVVPGARISPELIDAHPAHPTPRPVTVAPLRVASPSVPAPCPLRPITVTPLLEKRGPRVS
ncbi:hypothetical protein CATRI_01950 [Corynebacterium atrinae]|uniref:Asp23/Gls24 family envelope stress response protein n=1 Tax=Corynebacterium atrinae TaxID=1336740 RepID=UPI0025B34C6C|nr:Asp23/Gls24 family envelope stress response protein [Corynebacterium atrinae]WJY62495.1 hypothetical protein CATRI_01950 [Corynebacterium atrinae]